MDVSIIVNSYNLSSYISFALNSLLQQDYTGSYEVIVVDDASTDATKTVLHQFKDERLRIIYLETNQGARYATELAFEQCSGKYICRFDADDQWPSYFISKAVAVLEAHGEVDMVYGDCTFIDAAGTVTSANNNIQRKQKEQPVLDNEFEEVLKLYYINAPTIMFRRTAFAKSIPMPAHLSNFIDWFITLTVLQNGKAYYIHEPMAYYRIHTTNMHRQQVSSKMGETVTRFILQRFVAENMTMTADVKKQIIAKNYFVLGEKYFGIQLWKDAARLYKEAIQYNGYYVFNTLLMKHYFGALFPGLYQQLKSK